MTATRRSFLIGIGAALAAPAVVRAESLMKLWVPPAKLISVMDFYPYNGAAIAEAYQQYAMTQVLWQRYRQQIFAAVSA